MLQNLLFRNGNPLVQVDLSDKKNLLSFEKLILDLQRKKRQKPLQTPHEVKLLEITIFKKES